jgi:hypothetical protein
MKFNLLHVQAFLDPLFLENYKDIAVEGNGVFRKLAENIYSFRVFKGNFCKYKVL